MKNNSTLIQIIATSLALTTFFSACKKDPVTDSNKIQQGNTTIEMNAIYAGYDLRVRYNNVINAAINATVRVYQNGNTLDVPVHIPAGYKGLQNWANDDYVNVWNYNAYYDSTGTIGIPVISGAVDSVKIIAVSCPDKEYGFKIIDGSVDWSNFYHPKDAKTTVSFICNTDTITYSNYDFNSGTVFYNKAAKVYRFSLFNAHYFMVSDVENYPLQQGMTMNIPTLVYNWNGRNYGVQPDGPQAQTNGSTLQLTITKLSAANFEATFSGKVWSSRQADTLFISKGEIKNVLLPVPE